jgi:tRNA A-37 threonylcarbamoyl transferase component Bud32
VSEALQQQLQSALGKLYTLERELGGGGMSRVFVAHETSLSRKVVVKVLLPELAAGVNIDRFRREIQLAAQLQHPHIVPLLAAGEAEGLPYFIMPFVTGESLRARVTREGELPVSETVRILRDVVSALAYAHSFGVIHRDVKPDNVLLSGGVAVVTDFGVAKAVTASADSGATGLTSLGVALGTPAYMAPEQATASPQTDHRADIYALGIMAYELLTGLPPFAGRPPQAVLAAHVIEDPEPVERRRAAVPPVLAALVRDCLAKRPADRPQSAAQVMLLLDSIATPSGGTAATTAVRVPAVGLTPPPNRRRWTVPVVALGLAGLIALGAVIARREQPPRAAAPVLGSTIPAPAPPAVEAPIAAAPPEQTRQAPASESNPAKPKPTHRRATPFVAAPLEKPPAGDRVGGEQPAAAPTSGDSANSSAAAPLPLPPTPTPPPEETVAVKAPLPSPPTPPAPAPSRPVDLQRELQDVVQQYAAAIEARNLASLQRVYPGMTQPQQRGWEQFFQLVKEVRADLDITSLDQRNAAPEAQVTGTYSYLNTSTGKTERQPVSFRASFRRDGGQWRIGQVR